MKVLVTGFGSTGDTMPLIALAVSLRDRGHEVVVLTDQNANDAAAKFGLDLRLLPGDAKGLLKAGALGDRVMEEGKLSPGILVKLARFNTAEWLEAIDQAADGVDVIVAATMVIYHALSVGERKGIPTVYVQLQPAIPTKDYPPALLGNPKLPRLLNLPASWLLARFGEGLYVGAINKVRRSWGQPKLRLDWRSKLGAGAWSPTILPPSDWPGLDMTVTGPWIVPTDPGWQPPKELADFLAAGEPPIYVGFGSMVGFGDPEGLRDQILAGLAGRRVVLHGGWAELGDEGLPANVCTVGWVPHEWLFSRCAAVMHHCGAGTTHAAARAGVPSIPVPFAADQPFWADRLYKLGVASTPIPRRKLTPAAVSKAVEEAMTKRGTARVLGDVLKGEPDGALAGAEVVERAVSTPSSG